MAAAAAACPVVHRPVGWGGGFLRMEGGRRRIELCVEVGQVRSGQVRSGSRDVDRSR